MKSDIFTFLFSTEILLIAVFLAGFLSLIFLASNFRSVKRQLRHYQSQFFQQRSMLAQKEEKIKVLSVKVQRLIDSRNFFLNSLVNDLKNPVTVIKNHHTDWFEHQQLGTDNLGTALTTESSIAAIESLIQRAQAILISDNALPSNKTAQQSDLNNTLKRMLQKLPDSLFPDTSRLFINNELHHIIPVPEQVLVSYLSFYLDLLLKHLADKVFLSVSVEEQNSCLVLTIRSTTESQSFIHLPQPEKESGYFLIEGLARQIGSSATFASDLASKTLLRIQFNLFSTGSSKRNEDAPEYTPATFSDTEQQSTCKSGPKSDSPKCLILEPSPEIRTLLTSSLSGYFACQCADSLSVGLDLYEKWQPDLIILEPVQGSENGFDFLQAISSKRDISSIAIIIVSSKDDQQSRLRALEFDIFTFFNKPFNKQILFKTAVCLYQTKTRQKQFLEVTESVSFPKSRDATFLAQLNNLIETQIDNPDFRFEDYFDQFALSKRQFFRRVNTLTRCTPRQYMMQKRLELARHLLSNGCLVDEVTQRCGFKSSQTMMKLYHSHFGEQVI